LIISVPAARTSFPPVLASSFPSPVPSHCTTFHPEPIFFFVRRLFLFSFFTQFCFLVAPFALFVALEFYVLYMAAKTFHLRTTETTPFCNPFCAFLLLPPPAVAPLSLHTDPPPPFPPFLFPLPPDMPPFQRFSSFCPNKCSATCSPTAVLFETSLHPSKASMLSSPPLCSGPFGCGTTFFSVFPLFSCLPPLFLIFLPLARLGAPFSPCFHLLTFRILLCLSEEVTFSLPPPFFFPGNVLLPLA